MNEIEAGEHTHNFPTRLNSASQMRHRDFTLSIATKAPLEEGEGDTGGVA